MAVKTVVPLVGKKVDLSVASMAALMVEMKAVNLADL